MLFIGTSRKSFWPRLLAGFSYGVPLVFIVLPFASFLAYGFFRLDNGDVSHVPSLANYTRFFTDTIFVPVLW
ncbi:MAG: ABC transporter permease, partial [Aestuariivirga sp.]